MWFKLLARSAVTRPVFTYGTGVWNRTDPIMAWSCAACKTLGQFPSEPAQGQSPASCLWDIRCHVGQDCHLVVVQTQKSCLILCDPVDCSMPGSSVLHYLVGTQ